MQPNLGSISQRAARAAPSPPLNAVSPDPGMPSTPSEIHPVTYTFFHSHYLITGEFSQPEILPQRRADLKVSPRFIIVQEVT